MAPARHHPKEPTVNLAAVKQAPKFLKTLAAELPALLKDLAALRKPAVASAAAGVAAPIILAVAGVNVTAAELAADLTVFGGLAALLQRVLAKPAPAPAQPAK